jgi:hypothetical protein
MFMFRKDGLCPARVQYKDLTSVMRHQFTKEEWETFICDAIASERRRVTKLLRNSKRFPLPHDLIDYIASFV